jgi:hypothetical protein
MKYFMKLLFFCTFLESKQFSGTKKEKGKEGKRGAEGQLHLV